MMLMLMILIDLLSGSTESRPTSREDDGVRERGRAAFL